MLDPISTADRDVVAKRFAEGCDKGGRRAQRWDGLKRVFDAVHARLSGPRPKRGTTGNS